MSGLHQQAQLLYDQSRYDLCIETLRRILGQDVDDPWAHAVLAFCLQAQGKLQLACGEAAEAVRCGPDDPFAHYAMGRSIWVNPHYRPIEQPGSWQRLFVGDWTEQARLREAESHLRQSLALDPRQPWVYSTLAWLEMSRNDLPKALAEAERGLAVAPDDVDCANDRALVLIRMGRHAEAGQTAQVALSFAPESAQTHTLRGWSLLGVGQGREALEHFAASLRLQPDNPWTRAGLAEAMKANSRLYRMVDRMNRCIRRARTLGGRVSGQGGLWLIVLTIFAIAILGTAIPLPYSAPLLMLVPIIFVVFVVGLLLGLAGKLIDHLFTLLIATNPSGFHALTPQQRLASGTVLVFGWLLVWLPAGLIAGFYSWPACAVLGAGAGLGPLLAWFAAEAPSRRRAFAWTSLGLAVAGASVVAVSCESYPPCGWLIIPIALGSLVPLAIVSRRL